MSNHVPKSQSESKKRASGLPSFLSNLRNAQGVIGRATDDLHDRETRPFLKGQSQNTSRTQSSFSANLQNFTDRFGSKWRKRSRTKIGKGVTGVPQSFFLAVGCFFFAFPLLFLLFILARHAVFGDEDDISQAHKHEVPIHPTIVYDPEDEIRGVGYSIIGDNQASVNGDAALVHSHMVNENDLPEILIQPATSGVHDEIDQTIADTPGQIEIVNMIDPIAETNTDGVASENDGGSLARNEIKPKHDMGDPDNNIPEQAAILSTSVEKEQLHVTLEKESSPLSNLRGSHSKSKGKER